MVPIQTPRLLIRLLTPGDIPALITLWMDPEVTRHVRALSPKGEVQLLGDYAGSPGEIVEDPYGGSDDEYKACVEQLGRLVTAVADRLEAAASAEPSTP
jgi:protein-tyrosine-phosphatase